MRISLRRFCLSGFARGYSTPAACSRSWEARVSRSRMLCSVSAYSLVASGAGPRLSESACTMTAYSYRPRRMCNCSPMRIMRETFARVPPIRTFPPLMASAASARVLKNLAAHNHLSSLTLGIGSVAFNSIPQSRSKHLQFMPEINSSVPWFANRLPHTLGEFEPHNFCTPANIRIIHQRQFPAARPSRTIGRGARLIGSV